MNSMEIYEKGFCISLMVCLSMMFWTTGCSDKKPVAVDTTAVDSELVVDTAVVETMDSPLLEQPLPKGAAEMFFDFIFTFCSKRKFKLGRVKFPLYKFHRETYLLF